MNYTEFWGLCALALLLLAHGLYLSGAESESRWALLKHGAVAVLLGLCAAAFVGGVVMILCRAEDTAVYVMGLVMLLSAFALDGWLSRHLPDVIKKEEQEDSENE